MGEILATLVLNFQRLVQQNSQQLGAVQEIFVMTPMVASAQPMKSDCPIVPWDCSIAVMMQKLREQDIDILVFIQTRNQRHTQSKN